ncbi:hypothetical protein [Xenorhabdus littoralis]|uniref:hypothetical protein n=1 Tax=Xenorhabdus littoralis TaxID=2582835 RepID=UPI0029E8167A|nr:hypothetical protein [Xenorhabdus sp. psl]
MTTPIRISIEYRNEMNYHRSLAASYGRGSDGYRLYTKIAWHNRKKSREWAAID